MPHGAVSTAALPAYVDSAPFRLGRCSCMRRGARRYGHLRVVHRAPHVRAIRRVGYPYKAPYRKEYAGRAFEDFYRENVLGSCCPFRPTEQPRGGPDCYVQV